MLGLNDGFDVGLDVIGFDVVGFEVGNEVGLEGVGIIVDWANTIVFDVADMSTMATRRKRTRLTINSIQRW